MQATNKSKNLISIKVCKNHLALAFLIRFVDDVYFIPGLDPALPFFATLKNEWKLDPLDAEFVDVIHTSAGSFGKIEAAGHVDFYVNGGYSQPACENFTCK